MDEPVLDCHHLLQGEGKVPGHVWPLGIVVLNHAYEMQVLGFGEHVGESACSEFTDAEEGGDELEAPKHIRANATHRLLVAPHDAPHLVLDHVNPVTVLAYEVQFLGIRPRNELRHEPLAIHNVAARAEVDEM